MAQDVPCRPLDPNGPRKGQKANRKKVQNWIRGRHDPSVRGRAVEWTGASRPITGLDLRGMDLQDQNLSGLQLPKADLEGADLSRANLENTNLFNANLRGAKLYRARLQGASVVQSRLDRSDLRRAIFSGATNMSGAVLYSDCHGSPLIAGARWSDANLMDIPWDAIKTFADETLAHSSKNEEGNDKTADNWDYYYQQAAQTYLQLAMALRQQGIDELADEYFTRAQELTRAHVLGQRRGRSRESPRQTWHRWQRLWSPPRLQRWRRLAALTFSRWLAGYGHSLVRCFFWYAVVIVVFAGAYYVIAEGYSGTSVVRDLVTLNWGVEDPEQAGAALANSVAVFHGRGFDPNPPHLTGWGRLLPAAEAVAGLIIEAAVIATFARRFLAR